MHRPHFPVAILGHHQHGKSSLCRALAAATSSTRPLRGADDDVRVGTALVASRRLTLLDVPGGPRSVHAALRACAVADAAVLVVYSTRGPQAQTREHLLAARAAGIANVVIVINDGDGDAELLEACEVEVRGLLVDHGDGGNEAVVVTGSIANNGARVAAAVLAALEGLAGRVVDDEAPAVVRLLFAHPGLSRGHRAVASGRLLQGTLGLGDEVRVVGGRGPITAASFPKGPRSERIQQRQPADEAGFFAAHTQVGRVTRLEVEGQQQEAVRAGEQMGLELDIPGQTFDAFLAASPRVDRQSCVLLGSGHAGLSTTLQARLALRPAAIGGRSHPLRSGFECLAWTGSSSTLCTVLPVDASGNDAVAEAASTFDAAVLLALPRLASPQSLLVLTGAGGVIATGVVDQPLFGAAADRYQRRLATLQARRRQEGRQNSRARRAAALVGGQ